MKRLKSLLLCCATAVSFQVSAQTSTQAEAGTDIKDNAGTASLTLEITPFETTVGRIVISIFNSPDTFFSPDKFRYHELNVAESIVNGKVSTTFELPVGEYAVAVYHDSNDNGKMDTNFIGIPEEPSGMSNGHVPKFGPPRYDASKIQLPAEGLVEVIHLN